MNGTRASLIPFPIEGDLTHSPAGERYAEVMGRLVTAKGHSQQILVTSPGNTEGKSVTAVNLALAFHTCLVSVLLAELSFVRPCFSGLFGQSPLSRGMEDVLAKDVPLQDVVCIRNDNNLNVTMVNQPQATNELLQSNAQLDRLLAEARRAFSWTIFDGPSVESTPDIASLAKKIGMVILVVRARRTKKIEMTQALERISHPNTFVLLNDD